MVTINAQSKRNAEDKIRQDNVYNENTHSSALHIR